MTKRTFIAIHIRPDRNLLQLISEIRKSLHGSTINWVNPATLHLTLCFLGNTTPAQIKYILRESQGIFGNLESFQLELKGLGKFGSGSNPKVLWVGFEANDALSNLAGQTKEMVRRAGFDDDERAFRPHLTLGRIKWLKEAGKLTTQLEAYREVTFQRMMVNEVVFYESILRPAGPLYHPIQKFALKE